MTQFCSNCGNEIKVGSKFCNKCGQPVNRPISHNDYFEQETVIPKETNGNSHNISTPDVQNASIGINKNIVIALIATILVIGVYFMFGRSSSDSPDMVVKTFGTTACDLLNNKNPDLKAYDAIWKKSKNCQDLKNMLTKELSSRTMYLYVPIQNRGEITYLLGKNESIQKDDRCIRFIGLANKNSKNIYGCFSLTLQKIDGKYYIINCGYDRGAEVKNRDYYKEP